MKHLLFKELDKDGKEVRQVSISEEQAKRLNARAKKAKEDKERGVFYTYELVKEKKKDSSSIVINGNNYEKSLVINAINNQSFDGVKKVSANTGLGKVQALFDGLSDDQKTAVVTALS